MPCGITVFPNVVRVTGSPDHLEVQGTATGCTGVAVHLVFGGDAIPADSVTFAEGVWTATFPLFAPLECGTDVELTVVVDCRPDPCPDGVTRKSGTFRVKCRDGSCTKSPGGIVSRRLSADCDASGEQRMGFSVGFVPRLPSGTEGHFSIYDATGENVANSEPAEADANGEFGAALSLPPGQFLVVFRASGRPGCLEARMFAVPACSCPAGRLRVQDRQGNPVAEVALGGVLDVVDCVPPSSLPLRLSVQLSTQLPGVAYGWFRDGAVASAIGETLPDVTLPPNGDRVSFRARVDRAGCPGTDTTVTLGACPPGSCPAFGLVEVHKGGADGGVAFEVVDQDPAGAPPPAGPRFVSGDPAVPCLVAGRYTLVVRGFDPAYRYFWYDGDGTRKGEITDGTLGYELTADHGADDTLSIAAAHPRGDGTDCFRIAVPMQVCDCDGEVTIALFDVSRDVGEARVGPEECLIPGSYEARAEGPDPDHTVYLWRLNPRDASDVRGETGAVMGFEATPGFFCGDAYLIEVEARPRGNPDACVSSARRTARVCPDWAGCIECWILRLILMVIMAMTLAAMAFSICPSLTEIPWLRWLAIYLTMGGDASYVGRAAWVVWGVTHAVFFTASRVFIFIAVVAFIAGIFVFIAYLKYCKLSRCYDWMVLGWQALLVLGFTLAFYGSCPSCVPFQEYVLPGMYASNAGGALIMVGLGALLMAAGLVVWALWWLVFCKPNTCRALFELGSLAFVVNLLGAGLPAYVLAPCLWTHGWVLMSVVLCSGSVLMTAATLCALYTMKARSRSLPQ